MASVIPPPWLPPVTAILVRFAGMAAHGLDRTHHVGKDAAVVAGIRT
jgi:hypothetical protein